MKFYAAAICAVVLSQGEGAAGLYLDFLHELYHATPASEMVVADMGVAMRSLRGSSNEWLKQFDEVPLELRRRQPNHPPQSAIGLTLPCFRLERGWCLPRPSR